MKQILKSKLSVQARYQAGLVLTTLTLAAFGLLVQFTQNALEEYVYSGQIGGYWLRMGMVLAAALAAGAVMRRLRGRSHALYQAACLVMAVGLILLMGYNILITFSEYSSGSYRTPVVRNANDIMYLSWNDVVWQLVKNARLFGCIDPARAEQVAYSYGEVLWRWESDAVLPVIWLRYGLWTVAAYIALACQWYYYGVICAEFVPRDTKLVMCVEEERVLGISLNNLAYGMALVAMLGRIFGPIMSVLGFWDYSGGILFCGTSVEYLCRTVVETGLPLAVMLYLLSLPEGADLEEETEENLMDVPREETIAQDQEEKTEAEEQQEAEPEPAVNSAVQEERPVIPMGRKTFLSDRFEDIISDMDDPYALPYFHVPEGWYYMINESGEPQLAEK